MRRPRLRGLIVPVIAGAGIVLGMSACGNADGEGPAPVLVAATDGDPVRVRVPRLGIDATLEPLDLGADLTLRAPAYGRAGWYAGGPEPGEPGRAVIAGHLDSKQGPDVFWKLGEARAGDGIVVSLASGRDVRFVVGDVGQFPRAEFPTDRVYGGPKNSTELRLITCGGSYDRGNGGYQDNVVVFAAEGHPDS